MKEKIKKIILDIRFILCVCFILVSVLMAGFLKMRNEGKDLTPPLLSVWGEMPVVTPNSDNTNLVNAITAKDETDGDVFDTIRIRSIFYTENSDEAVITFVARDSSNNIGTRRVNAKVEQMQVENGEQEAEAEADANAEVTTE